MTCVMFSVSRGRSRSFAGGARRRSDGPKKRFVGAGFAAGSSSRARAPSAQGCEMLSITVV